MQDIMDMLGSQLGRDSLDAVVGWAGESRDVARRAVDIAIPATICGIADYAQDENTASDLIARFRAGDYGQFQGANLVDALRIPGHGEEVVRGGQDLVQQLFGAREGGIVEGIAGAAGIGTVGARRILSLAVPLVLGMVGRHALATSMDGRELASYLFRQKELVAGRVPASLAPLLGLSRPVAEPIRIARPARRVPVDVEPRHGWSRAIPWIVAALAVLVGIVWLATNGRVTHRKHASGPSVEEATRDRAAWRTRVPGAARNPGEETVTVVPLPMLPPPVMVPSPSVATTEPEPNASARPSPETAAVGEETPAVGDETPAVAEETPADGEDGPADGEDGPAEMISRYLDTEPEGKQEFSLEVVNFETGSAELDEEDQEILDGVAEVLLDRPDTKVVIEGHADSQGGSAINRRLSKARAEAVERYLIDQDVDRDQLHAVGKSSQRPAKPNDSDIHRAENRRVDLVVKRV